MKIEFFLRGESLPFFSTDTDHLKHIPRIDEAVTINTTTYYVDMVVTVIQTPYKALRIIVTPIPDEEKIDARS